MRRKTAQSASFSRILQSPGWTDAVRDRLQTLIRKGSGRRLPVVFDFDNTLVCGDIGEATLAVLARSGAIAPEKLPPTFFPAFTPAGGRLVTLAKSVDLAQYYESFLAPTSHGDRDPTPMANGYALAVEVMQGITPFQIVEATRQAHEFSCAGEARQIQLTPGKTEFPAPYFYPEMVELLARLLEHQFDGWIVSASNVWSVRWMILKALPPLLRRHGTNLSIAPDRVVGISTLLSDQRNRLFKDAILVRELSAYASLNSTVLRRFRLTSRLHFPVPAYSGKIACIIDQIGRPPYLCVGDSPGDLPMMKFSENRLWIARLEKPDYQRAAVRAVRESQSSRWLVQPTLTKKSPGFLANATQLVTRLDARPRSIEESIAIWREFS